jgi:hypothetical protein
VRYEHPGDSNMKETTPEDRATEIVKPLVPLHAEERVTRSYKQWNQIVRDHIRSETGLRLSDGDGRLTIPVRVVKGFPPQLAAVINHYYDPIIWMLVVGQPKLGGLVQGLAFLIENWDQFEEWPRLPQAARDGRPTLEGCHEIASSLQQAAISETIRKEIQEIDEDILGAYQFSPWQGSSVALYWLPIAMVASMLDVSIEDLTVVVLIHELSHGYTHLGRDIDGARWDDSAFCKSDREVIEGLAQFYTEVVSGELGSRAPGLTLAYRQLLRLQSGPYLVHQDWLKEDRRRRGETVRFALIAARGHEPTDYPTWQRLMATTRHNLT